MLLNNWHRNYERVLTTVWLALLGSSSASTKLFFLSKSLDQICIEDNRYLGKNTGK